MNNANLPAMPNVYQESRESELYCPDSGLTKREYFAAKALQGICSGVLHKESMSIGYEAMALEAVEAADCLIAALEKED